MQLSDPNLTPELKNLPTRGYDVKDCCTYRHPMLYNEMLKRTDLCLAIV